ncbi:MAG: amidase [Pseudomonadota bacterium]
MQVTPTASANSLSEDHDVMTATEAVAAVARAETTVEALTARALERIAERDGDIQAFKHVDPDYTLAAARAADLRAERSPLAGVLVAYKDNIDTAALPTGYGSPIHEGVQPARDAACVALMSLAGATTLGKTVTTEFAHRHPGATANPWHTGHTPGGSSSGSAAAVANGLAPIAFGTQTTGSVIRPAAYCGVIGYKPTFGDINVTGVLPNTPSFDTVGIMARAVDDLVLARRALMDASLPALAAPEAKTLKFAICPTPFWDEASADMQQLVEDTARALERAGATRVDFDENGAFVDLVKANVAVSGYEFARTLAYERLHAMDRLSPILRDGRMTDGLTHTHADYVAGQRRLAAARVQLDGAFDAVDFVVTPAAPGAAPAGLGHTGSANFNMPWTSLHTPAITLPLRRDSAGLPLGLQLASRRYADDTLLAAARTVLDLDLT